MASSFETHRFAMLLRMRSSDLMEGAIRSQTLMVRSASSRVSNHDATGTPAKIQEAGNALPLKPFAAPDKFSDVLSTSAAASDPVRLL
jgi:hypothetical protein